MATRRQRWDDFIEFSRQLMEGLNLDEDGRPRGSTGTPPGRTGDADGNPPQ